MVSERSEKILDAFTFYCIPMLNPDGAAYTRENANKVDLNRDSQLTQRK
jgi:murein tripeptide amidase MpaA